jgi:hypothetical protein
LLRKRHPKVELQILNHESRASNFEAHEFAKHMIFSGTGRHLWLGFPHSETVHMNILN